MELIITNQMKFILYASNQDIGENIPSVSRHSLDTILSHLATKKEKSILNVTKTIGFISSKKNLIFVPYV